MTGILIGGCGGSRRINVIFHPILCDAERGNSAAIKSQIQRSKGTCRPYHSGSGSSGRMPPSMIVCPSAIPKSKQTGRKEVPSRASHDVPFGTRQNITSRRTMPSHNVYYRKHFLSKRHVRGRRHLEILYLFYFSTIEFG